jgi:hypothetical protein
MRKTFVIALAMVLALGASGWAAAGSEDAGRPAQQWIAVFDGAAQKDDKFINVLEAREGGYVAVGMSERAEPNADGQSAYDGVIVKYAADGSEQWKATVPFSKLESVIETERGYLAVGVTTSAEAPFEARAALQIEGDAGDAAAVFFDKQGGILWATAVGGSGYDSFAAGDWSSVNDPQLLENGNFLLAGNTASGDRDFEGKGSGEQDAFLAEVDPSGALVNVDVISSSASDYAYSLIALSDGGFALAGALRGNWNEAAQKLDPIQVDGAFDGAAHSDWNEGYAFVRRLDAQRQPVWTKLIESHGPYNLTLAELPDGGILLGGDGFEMNPGADKASGLALYKLDAAGGVAWAKAYTSGKSLYFTSLSLDKTGGILVTGEDYYDSVIDEGADGVRGWLGFVDADGNLTASRTYGTSDFEVLFQARVASDGGVVCAGEQASEKGDWDASVVKYAPLG